MKRFRIIFKEEKGAILPIVAIAIFTIIAGFGALAVDAGYLYGHKRTIQTAADAAALAGAQILGESNDIGKAKDMAKEMAIANRAEDSKLDEITFPIQDVKIGEDIHSMQVIKVRARDNDNELFFAKLLGIVESDLVAEAAATWGYIMGDIIPLFTVEEGLGGGTLSDKHLGIDAGGNWGFLLDENDNKYKREDLIDFLKGEKSLKRKFVVGEKLGGTSTGIEKQATVPGIEGRMINARKVDKAYRKDIMTVTIPVLDLDKKGGNSPATILYFISALIEDVVDKDGIGSEYALGEDFNRKISDDKLDWNDILPDKGNHDGTIIVKFDNKKIYDLNEAIIHGGQIGIGSNKYQKLVKFK